MVGFGFDAAGNPTRLTPPGRPGQTSSYSDRTQLTAVVPPAVPGTGPTTFAYDADKALTTVRWYAHAARAPIRVGLRGLTARVAAVGCRLVVSIPPGHGSRVRAHLPCT